ncbi:hypothetical protein ACWKWU_00340 [Chitinophaga lutea]
MDIVGLVDVVIAMPQHYIYIFPVVSFEDGACEGFGVTASARDFDKIEMIKKELKTALDYFWKKGLVVKDLYTGSIATKDNFISVFSDIW